MSLDEIAIKYGTDKSSKGHSYCRYYEMMLAHLRDWPINLLEIGIDEGASLKMWRDFFPIAAIHGIDIRAGYEYLHDGVCLTHVVDQSNKADLVLFAEQHKNYFDIITDDGSHVAEDSILSFEVLFPYLRAGGYYCIEDANCSNDKTRWGKNANVYDRVKQMIDEVNMSGKFSNDALCANKKKEASKYDLSIFEKDIEWVFNSMSLIIIKKMSYI